MSTTEVLTQTPSLSLKGEAPPRLSLKDYPRIELSPALGLRFSDDFHFHDIFKKSDAEKDEFFKALTYEISLNGVAVFPSQHDVTNAEIEIITKYLNKFGAPADGGLHVHPIQDDWSDEPGKSTRFTGGPVFNLPKDEDGNVKEPDNHQLPNWHSDVSCEARPPSYSLLRVYDLPRTGGDTLFGSQYAFYDKLSPSYAKFVEGLSALHSGDKFKEFAKTRHRTLNEGPRGAAENVGLDFDHFNPVVRTNPVTGLKGLFVNPGFTRYIDNVPAEESSAILGYLFKLQRESHDAQVRVKWNKNDIVIWDNRSTIHTATFDYGLYPRAADRSVVIGEKPYFDAHSLSRKEYNELHPQRLDLAEIQV